VRPLVWVEAGGRQGDVGAVPGLAEGDQSASQARDRNRGGREFDREVLMEVALPGNPAFEFDDPASCDYEAEAGRFALVGYKVVDGDSGSSGGSRRDDEPFGEEGPGDRIASGNRDRVGRIHDQPGFVAPDDRAFVTFRNEGVRCDFFFEFLPRALGAALGVLGESRGQVHSLRFQHSVFEGKSLGIVVFDQGFDHPWNERFVPDDVLVKCKRWMPSCLRVEELGGYRRAKRFGGIRRGDGFRWLRHFAHLIFVTGPRLPAVRRRRRFVLRFDDVPSVRGRECRQREQGSNTHQKQCDRALCHQFSSSFCP
jgi:hypothetical protein